MISEERVQFNLQYIDKMKNYVCSNGVRCNLDNPETIQEKLMWLNIYDADTLKTDCADKLKVKEYAFQKTSVQLGVPTIAVWDKVEDIDFSTLPECFVLKCNHGSGMNIIVRDKSQINEQDVINKLQHWMNDDFAFRNGFESHYHWIERKVFAEEFIEVKSQNDIPDYKFLCFNGCPQYMLIMSERNGPGRRCNYYDMNLEKQTLCRIDFMANYSAEDVLPSKFDEMKELAKKLSQDFKFVRVDFYETNGRIYLGELTFTPGAFIFKYENKDDEIAVGGLLKL